LFIVSPVFVALSDEKVNLDDTSTK